MGEPKVTELDTHNVAYMQPTIKTANINECADNQSTFHIPLPSLFHRASRQRRDNTHQSGPRKQIRDANQSNMTSPPSSQTP